MSLCTEMYQRMFLATYENVAWGLVIWVGKRVLDAILSHINEKIGDGFHFQRDGRRLNYQFSKLRHKQGQRVTRPAISLQGGSKTGPGRRRKSNLELKSYLCFNLDKMLKFDLKRDDHDSFEPSRQIATQIFFKKHYEPNKFNFCLWNGVILSQKKMKEFRFLRKFKWLVLTQTAS